jgi:caffeoyl-CoA O-methyltransferase
MVTTFLRYHVMAGCADARCDLVRCGGYMAEQSEFERLREYAETRDYIDRELAARFAPEDEALRGAVEALDANDMPHITISPLQGRLLQILALSVGAKRILEIGALSGYSGIWLVRGLAPDGKLISLEFSGKHAAVAQASLARAGLGDRAEVRVGAGLDLLPALASEPPFDLVFIDADKPSYVGYLDWALRLTRIGGLIVADNCIRGGAPLRGGSDDPGNVALGEYDRRVAADPRLVSVALPIRDNGTDGFAISVVVAPDTTMRP